MATIKDTDLLLVNRGGVDYKITALKLKENFGTEPPLPPRPWDGHDGGIWHIKNVEHEVLKLGYGSPYTAWDIDGTNEREITEIAIGEELVFVTPPDQYSVFGQREIFYADWEFGEFTDTSKVISFSNLFSHAQAFTGPLGGNWDTSNVRDMSYVFDRATSFNEPIGHWDTSNVLIMLFMFFSKYDGEGGYAADGIFNQDISNWDVSKVQNMVRMFSSQKDFNQDLSNWCVTNNASLPANFDEATDAWEDKNKPVWGTCPPRVPDELDLLLINRSGRDYALPATEIEALTDDVDLLVVNRDDVDYKVSGKDLKDYLSSPPMPWEGHNGGIWHIKNVENYVLYINSQSAGGYTAWDIDGTNEREVTEVEIGEELVFVTTPDVNGMFSKNGSKWDFGRYTDTSKVTDMDYLFGLCEVFNSDIGGWDTSNVTNMDRMFQDDRIFNQDLSNWCVTKITSEPIEFDEYAADWTEPRPCWGHCPRGENGAVDPCPKPDYIGEPPEPLDPNYGYLQFECVSDVFFDELQNSWDPTDPRSDAPACWINDVKQPSGYLLSKVTHPAGTNIKIIFDIKVLKKYHSHEPGNGFLSFNSSSKIKLLPSDLTLIKDEYIQDNGSFFGGVIGVGLFTTFNGYVLPDTFTGLENFVRSPDLTYPCTFYLHRHGSFFNKDSPIDLTGIRHPGVQQPAYVPHPETPLGELCYDFFYIRSTDPAIAEFSNRPDWDTYVNKR